MNSKPIRIVQYLNQFFAGLGGEEKAGAEVQLFEGAVGPGLGLNQALAKSGEVVATLMAGDDYWAANQESASSAVRRHLQQLNPDCVVAGPAFNSGRYGLACGRVCQIAGELSIPAVSAMFPGNPAVDIFRRDTWILPAEVSARGMREALPRLAAFALRLCSGTPLGKPDDEGYLPRGIRLNQVCHSRAAHRVLEILLAKLAGRPFETEIPIRTFKAIKPAAPIPDLSESRLGLLSTGGIVPRGNPDGLKHVNESRWRRYSIQGLAALNGEDWEPIHGGFDASHARRNPNLIVPLDGLRRLESRGRIASLCEYLYSVVGVGASTATCSQIGDEVAADMLREGVAGVILTST